VIILIRNDTVNKKLYFNKKILFTPLEQNVFIEYEKAKKIKKTHTTAALLGPIIHHSYLLDFTNRDSRRLKDALLKQSPGEAGKAKYRFPLHFLLTKNLRR